MRDAATKLRNAATKFCYPQFDRWEFSDLARQGRPGRIPVLATATESRAPSSGFDGQLPPITYPFTPCAALACVASLRRAVAAEMHNSRLSRNVLDPADQLVIICERYLRRSSLKSIHRRCSIGGRVVEGSGIPHYLKARGASVRHFHVTLAARCGKSHPARYYRQCGNSNRRVATVASCHRGHRALGAGALVFRGVQVPEVGPIKSAKKGTRDRRGRFLRGQSGNPAGRPPGCRDHVNGPHKFCSPARVPLKSSVRAEFSAGPFRKVELPAGGVRAAVLAGPRPAPASAGLAPAGSSERRLLRGCLGCRPAA